MIPLLHLALYQGVGDHRVAHCYPAVYTMGKNVPSKPRVKDVKQKAMTAKQVPEALQNPREPCSVKQKERSLTLLGLRKIRAPAVGSSTRLLVVLGTNHIDCLWEEQWSLKAPPKISLYHRVMKGKSSDIHWFGVLSSPCRFILVMHLDILTKHPAIKYHGYSYKPRWSWCWLAWSTTYRGWTGAAQLTTRSCSVEAWLSQSVRSRPMASNFVNTPFPSILIINCEETKGRNPQMPGIVSVLNQCSPN